MLLGKAKEAPGMETRLDVDLLTKLTSNGIWIGFRNELVTLFRCEKSALTVRMDQNVSYSFLEYL